MLPHMESCPNIGVRGRRRRLRFGIAAFTAAAALALMLSLLHATPWLRALVFLPLAGGFHGFFQYREKT